MTSQSRDAAAPAAGQLKGDKKGIIAWCIFDWANSAFPTVVITFVFANYYTAALASSPEQATSEWGNAISLSGLAVAILAPICGAVADLGGRRKPWLLLFSLLCIAAGMALWTVEPDPSFALRALILVAIANATFELGQVFYNAMLPEIAPRPMLGRISGWAWGIGYAGGLVCLTLTLVFLILPEKPLFGLEMAKGEPARASAVLVSLWYLIFAVPLFLYTPDQPSSGIPFGRAVRQGLAMLARTLGNLRRHGNIARYLLARMIYTDGLNTLFIFGGVYAAGHFGMDTEEVLIFAILLNITAGIGAAAFGWIDDAIGAKRTILIAVTSLTVVRRPDPDRRVQAVVLHSGLRARHLRRPGPVGQPFAHGAPGARGDAHRDVRALRALGQGDRLRRPGAGRLGHPDDRQPAARHGDDPGVLRHRPVPDAAGARGVTDAAVLRLWKVNA